MNNLEWLLENDGGFKDRFVLMAHDLPHTPTLTENETREWLMAEHSNAEEQPEAVVTASVDTPNATEPTLEGVDSLAQADVAQEPREADENANDVDDGGPWLNAATYYAIKSAVEKWPDWKKEAFHVLDDSHLNQLYVLDEHNMRRLYHIGFMDCKEGRYNMPAHGLNNIEFVALSDYENKRQYADQPERVSTGDCGSDSCEKLEADVNDFVINTLGCGLLTYGVIMKLLDRQAEITKRECDAANVGILGIQAHERECYKKRIDELTADRAAWRKRFEKVNREKCDLQSSGVAQRFNNLCNRLRDKGITIRWDDSRSDYSVLLPQERTCPGYDPDEHRCNYHAQDFELNDATVSRLKRENAKLQARLEELALYSGPQDVLPGDEGYDYERAWSGHVRYIGELQAERKKLQDENAKLSSDELHWRNQAQAFKAECERLRGMLVEIAGIATEELTKEGA